MTMPTLPARAHLITGGFPRGQQAGHDHDYARLRLLDLLREQGIGASVANDFRDVEDWLPLSRLLITYVAGPYPDAAQSRAIARWMEQGGRWLGLHGTSGGRAVRVAEGSRQRKMIRMAHHTVLGGYFLSHPPVRRFSVAVEDGPSSITKDLPAGFEVIDEPYMIEVVEPAESRILLTADFGPNFLVPGFGMQFDEDTSLLPDGKRRAFAYTRDIGRGGVTYIALGHCHDPASNVQSWVDESVSPDRVTPLTLRYTWEVDAFITMLRNSITWGMGGE